ncbi:MAG: NUDIX hydrolase [Candidatus Nanohaloarchaea archaeon]
MNTDGIVELAGNVIIEEGEILLVHREDEGWWDLPGGKVEEDESPTEAAVREAREEIGVEVELEKPFFSGEFQHSGELFLWHGYLARLEEGVPEAHGEKFSDVEWFSGEELDELELAPNLGQILPALRDI